MKTQELITVLAQDIPRKQLFKLEVVAVFITALGCLVTKCWLGLRPELQAMTLPMTFFFKTAVLSAMAILTIHALKASSVPLGRFTLKHLGLVLAAVFVLALGREWVMSSCADIKALFLLPNFKACLIYVTLYGSAISITITLLVKHAAPLYYDITAGYIGLASACLGAVGYSIHCPIDSPTFILVAYGLPQAFLYTASRLLLPKFLRW